MSSSLVQGYEEMATYIQGELGKVALQGLKDTSEEVKKEVDELYENFFTILKQVVGGAGTSTPALLSGNLGQGGSWHELSALWYKRKRGAGALVDFYKGLTNIALKPRPRLKRGQAPRARRRSRKGTSFMQYLDSLASSRGATSYFFGPTQIEYLLTSEGRRRKLDVVDEKIPELTTRRVRDLSKLDDLQLKAKITMFPNLAAVQFSEWYVVNYMAGLSGAEKQWVKVKGTGHGKPIRAIITPLISWYATDGMAKILRKFY